MKNYRGSIDWVGRLRLWAENPVKLDAETFRLMADEMERLRAAVEPSDDVPDPIRRMIEANLKGGPL